MKREFTSYTGKNDDNVESTVEAHHVTKDTAGTVNTIGNISREVREGDVLVRTTNPNVVDVIPKKSWDETGYAKGATKEKAVVSDLTPEPESDDDDDEKVSPVKKAQPAKKAQGTSAR